MIFIRVIFGVESYGKSVRLERWGVVEVQGKHDTRQHNGNGRTIDDREHMGRVLSAKTCMFLHSNSDH